MQIGNADTPIGDSCYGGFPSPGIVIEHEAPSHRMDRREKEEATRASTEAGKPG